MKLLTKNSGRNHMKIQKSVLFVKKNLKINIWKIKNIWKLERSLSFHRGIGAAHSICNLKYSVPKIHPIVFHNGANHDYHFIIKRMFFYYSLLIVQDLWQVHYQVSPVTILNEFIELNVNLDTVIKNVKHVELNFSIATVFSNTPVLKMI